MLLSDENLTPKTASFLKLKRSYLYKHRNQKKGFSSETMNTLISAVRACLGDLRRVGIWQERWNLLGHWSQLSSSPPVPHAAHRTSLESSSGAWSTCCSPPRVRMWFGALVLLWSRGLHGGCEGLWGLSPVLWRGALIGGWSPVLSGRLALWWVWSWNPQTERTILNLGGKATDRFICPIMYSNSRWSCHCFGFYFQIKRLRKSSKPLMFLALSDRSSLHVQINNSGKYSVMATNSICSYQRWPNYSKLFSFQSYTVSPKCSLAAVTGWRLNQNSHL